MEVMSKRFRCHSVWLLAPVQLWGLVWYRWHIHDCSRGWVKLYDICHYPNNVLSQKAIHNIRRSPNMSEKIVKLFFLDEILF